MLELRIKITPENAERVMRLIRELVVSEDLVGSEESAAVLDIEKTAETSKEVAKKYLSPPPAFDDLVHGEVTLTETAKYVGTWGQFNSFFPMKAVLRVLAHLMEESNRSPVSLQALVDKSVQAFKAMGLQRFRGFPKRYKRESSIGRLVWHFVTTACEMGLIKIEGDSEIPSHDWDRVSISITREGWEFSKLENRLLDWNGKEQVLTDDERNWMADYLKKIDVRGFREFSILMDVFEELKKGNTDISSWLERNENFRQYIRSWSRKTENLAEFDQQLKTVAIMFAQSKIALLREMGAISNRRNDYTVIGSLGD